MTTLGEGRYVQKEDLGSFGCLLGIGATPDSHKSKSRPQDLPTPTRGWQETEIFQSPLLFGNGLRLTTGIIWNALPREKFGGMSSSALHDKFQQWSIAGVFTKIWQRGLAEYDELKGIAWTWQAADSASIEAPLARESTGPNLTDRGEKRLKTTCSCRREWYPDLATRQCSQPA